MLLPPGRYSHRSTRHLHPPLTFLPSYRSAGHKAPAPYGSESGASDSWSIPSAYLVRDRPAVLSARQRGGFGVVIEHQPLKQAGNEITPSRTSVCQPAIAKAPERRRRHGDQHRPRPMSPLSKAPGLNTSSLALTLIPHRPFPSQRPFLSFLFSFFFSFRFSSFSFPFFFPFHFSVRGPDPRGPLELTGVLP